MVRSQRHSLSHYGSERLRENRRVEDRENGVARKTALDWVAERKAGAAGALCLAGIGGGVAYKLSRPSVKPVEEIALACRRYAPFTMAALAGAALIVCYQSGSGSRVYQYAEQYLPSDINSPKN